ncbi:MAG: hypothetical protein JWQ23_29, partial [Herminiimonas sp.]|nr:hypothetical protein [Herminiimonas sp.]
MICNMGEHMAQVCFWIESVELGAFGQTVQGSGPFAARVRAGEQIILPVMLNPA